MSTQSSRIVRRACVTAGLVLLPLSAFAQYQKSEKTAPVAPPPYWQQAQPVLKQEIPLSRQTIVQQRPAYQDVFAGERCRVGLFGRTHCRGAARTGSVKSTQQSQGQFGPGQFGPGRYGPGQFGQRQFGQGQFGGGELAPALPPPNLPADFGPFPPGGRASPLPGYEGESLPDGSALPPPAPALPPLEIDHESAHDAP